MKDTGGDCRPQGFIGLFKLAQLIKDPAVGGGCFGRFIVLPNIVLGELQCTAFFGFVFLLGQRQGQIITGREVAGRFQVGGLEIQFRSLVIFLEQGDQAAEVFGVQRIGIDAQCRRGAVLASSSCPFSRDNCAAMSWVSRSLAAELKAVAIHFLAFSLSPAC